MQSENLAVMLASGGITGNGFRLAGTAAVAS
jgi:hypothetical protein